MKIRFASALLAMALPLVAQDPAASATEAVFYKAFYLEKGQRDFAAAMALYDQFLAQAPDHKLASEAAKQQYGLLDRTGKTKERDAFKAKYGKLLGDVAVAAAPAGTDAGPGRGERGAGRGAGGEGRMDPAARLADLEKQLAKAKEEGDDEQVKKLTQQIERVKQMGERGGRGQAGPGRGGILGSTKKLAEMSPEELTQFKEGLGMMDTMLERMRERLGEEQVNKIETSLATLRTSLEGNKLEDAQKALDAIRAAMPARRGRGGEAGGGGGGNAGGGGGR